MSPTIPHFASLPETLRLGDLEVRRLGFGAMRLPGKDVWGEPDDGDRARAVLRRAVDLGVNFIDTAWFYGPHVANRLIAEALFPYPKGLVLATKLGGMRFPNKGWGPAARPEELRRGCEDDLRVLKRDAIDVVHLRYMGGSGVPLAESLGALVDMQKAGKIRHIALSNVSAPQLAEALLLTPIVAVQNLFNIAGGGGELARMSHAEVDEPERVLEACEARGIAFLPFFPLAVGALGKPHPALEAAARRHDATPAQIAIAWLLARSKVMLPIPGTSSLEHLAENCAAVRIALTKDEVDAIARDARGAA